jgi:hypothetical protein
MITKMCSKCKKIKEIDGFYKTIKKVGNNKDGFHSWCKECVREKNNESFHKKMVYSPEKVRDYANKYRKKNREKCQLLSKKSYEKRRYEALCYYGGNPPKCACCGETKIEFLSFDHINGGGLKHLRQIGRGNLMLWIRKNNYPKGFQILCHNCNFAKGHYGKCPHQK